MKVKEQSVVRTERIRNALEWLKLHNIHYNDVNIDTNITDNVICIDHSGQDCDSHCSRVESKYEYTGMCKFF